MNESISLPRWIRLPLIGIGLFLAGGLLAFGYSYRPLHGAMTWQIEELERRIDVRNLENLKLGDQLARLRSQEASQIDPDTFSQVERELGKTKKALAQAEKDLAREQSKHKESNSSASRWRKRYEELLEQKKNVPAAPAPSSSATPDITSRSMGGSISEPTSPSPAPFENGMLPADPATIAPGIDP